MKQIKLSLPVIAASGLLALTITGCSKKTVGATVDSYPLTTCVVSDEKLGEMGKPVVINHNGQEVKFCCKSCVKDFNKEPQKYLDKIAAAKK